ncbi:MAG: HesA/MoeB/ThiF family protein, partial [Fibrobacteres bacterium]|nr:HesA/MoeB/ThiF family protein [Fibrobacterota bacterium]
MDFSTAQLERYSRHILLKDIGIEGQARIMESSVLVIGTGGLGSPVALYLAAAGIGRLGIADGDSVDMTNLQRQVIHFTPDVGRSKVESALNKINALNPDVKVEPHNYRLKAENIRNVIRNYDFVIDATDNFDTKFMINDACVMERKPFSHGGVLRFTGQTMTVKPFESACYRCVFGAPPPADAVPTCSQAGILGSIAGMLGTIQATEALKFVSGAGTPLYDKLLNFDALSMDF